jgi:hypothetical protein
MKFTNNGSTGQIKRRKFFVYLGASIVGIFSISKLPLKIFQSKINSELSNRIKISENPLAVKRESRRNANG